MKKENLSSYIGKTVLSRGRQKVGIIKDIIKKYLYNSGFVDAFIVDWSDGKTRTNSVSGIKELDNGVLQLM